MKLAQHANELETNTEVQSQDFSIGDASVIIEIMRNRMYSHPIRTLVQEYMSNGRDATREAKSKEKIIVSLPNHLSPVFKVRDFGPGITPERMANVFIKYGASTKRDSNNQTGGFGIGAKSAWSYTDSFTIVSITGGMKRTYVAHIAVNNQGRLDLLSEVATDEATGAEIQIAVKPNDTDQFCNAIWRACYFWKDAEYPEFKGVIKSEIQKRKASPVDLTTGKYRIELMRGDNLPSFLGIDRYYESHLAIIDGIPYSLPDKITSTSKNFKKLKQIAKLQVILHVNNGDFEVAASRENIADCDFTKNNLDTITAGMDTVLTDFIKSEFAKAKTNFEWIETYHTLSSLVLCESYAKRGPYSIKNSMIESANFRDFEIYNVGANMGRRSRGGFKRERVTYIDLATMKHLFYADNMDEAMVTQNRRIKEYLEKVPGGGIRALLLVPRERTEMVMPNGKPQLPTTDGTPAQPVQLVSKVVVSLTQSEKLVNKVIADLGGKKLSSLPYTPIVRVPRAKTDRTKEMFTIHDCNENGKHRHTTTLQEVESDNTTYLYVNLKDYEKYRKEFAEMHLFLASVNKQVCALADKTIEVASTSTFFEEYETWKSNFKITKEILVGLFTKKASNKEQMKLLLHAQDKIKNKHIAKMLDQYKSIVNNGVIQPPEIIAKLAVDEVKEFTDNDAELTELLKKSYPLINLIASNGGYGYYKTEPANELVHYINSKV